MKILTENRLYMTQELESEIHIADGVDAMIYDEGGNDVGNADLPSLQKVTFGS